MQGRRMILQRDGDKSLILRTRSLGFRFPAVLLLAGAAGWLAGFAAFLVLGRGFVSWWPLLAGVLEVVGAL